MTRTGNSPLHELPDALARAIESARVPSLPHALLRLLVMADDDATTISELASVVEQDPGLCARILTAANSPGLRRGTQLNSVAHCLTALGTRLVRSIATCLSLQNLFDRRAEALKPDLADYWRHSIRVAEAAREIAISSGYRQPEEAYLAGLLHDIGELVLLSAHGTGYSQVLSLARDEGHLVSLEVERFEVHHGEVGAWLVDQWQFDFAVGDGILFHHATPEQILTADPLPQIVWLANALSTSLADDPLLVRTAEAMFGSAMADSLAQVAQRAASRTDQIAAAVGLGQGASGDSSNSNTLPRVTVSTAKHPDNEAENEIDAMMRDMALMQPLQRDLFGVESDAELLLSLRESARILFELAHIAFFLRTSGENRLSAALFGEQPALFRRASIRPDAPNCLVARAASTGRTASSFDDDYPQPPALIDIQFARVFGTEGLLCVPMNGRHASVGVMVFGLSSAQHGRLKKRLPWVLNFGRIAGLSLEAWHEAIDFRRRAEDDAAQRFERQARRVIHEAGNPLGIIRSYLKVLDGKLPENVQIREELGVLREEIDRVSSIVRRLSERPSPPEPGQGLDAGPLVRDLMSFYDSALFKARGIEASIVVDEPLRPVTCDRDSLKQILLNLWKNASEAMPSGGRIETRLADGVVQNGRPYLEIRIADNGPGIPPETLARLSGQDGQPVAAERGMGLSIVGTLVRQIGATIACRSKPKTGTEFILLIPCRQ